MEEQEEEEGWERRWVGGKGGREGQRIRRWEEGIEREG